MLSALYTLSHLYLTVPNKPGSGFPGSSVVKNPPPMQETKEMQVQSLGWFDPLEREMATHSSVLAWRIPQTEEPGGLQSTESQELDTAEHAHMDTNSQVLCEKNKLERVHQSYNRWRSEPGFESRCVQCPSPWFSVLSLLSAFVFSYASCVGFLYSIPNANSTLFCCFSPMFLTLRAGRVLVCIWTHTGQQTFSVCCFFCYVYFHCSNVTVLRRVGTRFNTCIWLCLAQCLVHNGYSITIYLFNNSHRLPAR